MEEKKIGVDKQEKKGMRNQEFFLDIWEVEGILNYFERFKK